MTKKNQPSPMRATRQIETKNPKVILGEIIGASNLQHPSNEEGLNLMHPFVVTMLHSQGKEPKLLNRTKRRKETCDPIWCIDQRCLFLLNVADAMLENEEDVSSCNSAHLHFDVRNKEFSVIKDPLSCVRKDPISCALIGSVKISVRDILNVCERVPEERIELQLHPTCKKECLEQTIEALAGKSSEKDNYKHEYDAMCDDMHESEKNRLAIRFRFATTFDQQFIQELNLCKDVSGFRKVSSLWKKRDMHLKDGERSKEFRLITEVDQKEIGVKGLMNMMSGFYKSNYIEGADGVRRERVLPGPDPCRIDETKFLSHEEMTAEMRKSSTHWTEFGANMKGSFGRVFLEILQCEGLPNMDAGEAIGNKTDAFVCAVYEESIAETTVIDDILSPMWMPWTQRAFCFNMKHAFSQLFISVNDFDIGPSLHDGIGRVVVNLNHFESNVYYTLNYKLHPAANVVAREEQGTLTIRLRKEVIDERAFLMSTLKPIPRLHINMGCERTLPVANFTLNGHYNEDDYDIQLLKSYVNELIELKRFLLYSVGDSFNSLVMWRGQVKVGNKCLPLHSAVAFFGGIYLVERPYLWPGSFFLMIAWGMLASIADRQQHPSPWHQTNSFFRYLSILLHVESFSTHKKKLIRSMENSEEAAKYESNWSHRISTDIDAAWKKWDLQVEMDKIGNEDLNTEQSKASADPIELALASLKPRLFPIQIRLRGYCQVLRKIKAVTTWEESIISFWITFLCIIVGVMLLILPTVLILHWTCRLFIWVGFGPWYRIYYEICVVKEIDPMALQNDEARAKHKNDTIEELERQFKKKGRIARYRGEEALKMKSMRKLRFGNFIAKVPRQYTARHYDYPLSESEAVHISLLSQRPQFEARNKIYSQSLDGTMIPLTQNQEITENTSNEKNEVSSPSLSPLACDAGSKKSIEFRKSGLIEMTEQRYDANDEGVEIVKVDSDLTERR